MNLLWEAGKCSLQLLSLVSVGKGMQQPWPEVGSCCWGVAHCSPEKPLLSSLSVEKVSWSKFVIEVTAGKSHNSSFVA